MTTLDDPDGPFIRRKFKWSFGDGPDNRGEVTVELADGVDNLDGSFADWYNEVDRAADTLREQVEQ